MLAGLLKKTTSTLLTGLIGIGLLALNGGTAFAHNVGQSQTSKFFAPGTVKMLQDRASGITPGGAGVRQGDTLSYIIQSVPSPNGATQGSAGYTTDYIPPGTQVVGAHFVVKVPDPTQLGGFAYVDAPFPGPGLMADGWGPRGANGYQAPSFAEGRLAQGIQDIGVFFSTDPRTARLATPYDITGCTKARLAGTQLAFLLYNQWDYDQFFAFGNTGGCVPVGYPDPKILTGGSGRGNPPLVTAAVPGTLAGLASPVAGPQTYYSNDFNPVGDGVAATNSVADFQGQGPWQRIYHPGSLIGGTGPVTAAIAQGPETITAVPTSSGWLLSPSNPLPANTNALRFAFGERVVGSIEHVRVDLRVTNLAAFAAGNAATPPYTNQSMVFGGDASGGAQNGKDHVYAYLGPSQANNSAQLSIVKEVVAKATSVTGPWLASTGDFAAPGEFLKYRLTYLNANSAPLHNVQIKDVIDTAEVTYISATSGNPFLGVASYTAPNVTWPTIPTLLPGEGGTVEVIVQVTNAGGGAVTQNTANAIATEVPAPGVTSIMVTTISATGAPPAITHAKTVSPTSGTAGTVLTYSLTLGNTGGAITARAKGNNNLGKGPVYPGTANIGLVVADSLPKLTGTNVINYTATTVLNLTDTTTGAVYPMTAGTDFTVDTATRPGDVFWLINRYPAGHPRAGQPFDFVNSRLDLSFTATVAAAPAPGIYTNQIETYMGDALSGKDLSKITTGLAPVAIATPNFLPFTKQAIDINGGSPAPGDLIRYDLAMTNSGTVAATNLVLTDPIPVNGAFVVGSSVPAGGAVTFSNDNGLTFGYIPTPGANGTDPAVTHVRWSFASLAAAATVTPSLQVRIQSPANNGLQLLNQATLTSTETGANNFLSDDPTRPGLQDVTLVTVVAAPDFSTSTKSVLVNGVAATTTQSGDTLSYSIQLTDSGNQGAGATNIQVSDTVDLTTLEQIVVDPAPAGWTVTGPDVNGRIVWSAASLVQGGSVTFSFTAKVKAGVSNGTIIRNAAVISSTESLPVTIQAPPLQIPLTQVTGTVFDDVNGNGTMDPGEVPLQGVTLALRLPGFVADVVTATTDANGQYVLVAPLSGSWDVLVTDSGGVVTGRSLTTGNQPLQITLSNGQTLAGQDFGYQLPASVTVEGQVFEDIDGNGAQDAGENGISNVSFTLHNGLGILVGQGITDATGLYSATGLLPGDYTLTLTDNNGILVNRYLTTTPGSPVLLTGLTAGSVSNTPFGYRIGSQIGDQLFDDVNGNGIQDVGESGLPGVTIELRPAGVATTLQTTTTDAAGQYLFQGVAPGSYDVVITDTAGVLSGFTATTTIQSPYTVTAVAGSNILTADFGYTAAPVISVSKSVDQGVVAPNQGVQFTLTLTNQGGAAQNMEIHDVLPSISAVAPYSVSANNFQYLQTNNVTLNGQPFTIPNQPAALSNRPVWSGFTLPGASTLKIAFSAFTGGNEGVNVNGVQVRYNNAPPAPIVSTDYPDLVTVTVSNAGQVNKQVVAINGQPWNGVGTPVIAAGDAVTYRVTLANTPAALSQSVSSITDRIPLGFVYQAGSSRLVSPVNSPVNPIADPTQAGQLLTWTLPVPAPATAAAYPSTLTLEFDLQAQAGTEGTFTDNATMQVTVAGTAAAVPVSSGDTAAVTVTRFRIGDLVFIDRNTNGVFDGADTGVANVTLELRPAGGAAGSAIASTTTAANGSYGFLIGTAGTYDVVITDQNGILLGHTVTTSGGNFQTHSVSTGAPQVTTADFGYAPPVAAATITGKIFSDTNGDGLLDTGETGLSGVTVELLNLFGTVIANSTTTALGDYSFTNLPGGRYQIRVATAPTGFDVTTTQPLSVTVADGGLANANNLGYQQQGQVTGRVFADTNNNGILDGVDSGLSGATVWLKVGTTVVATTTTDANGLYNFTGLSLGGNPSVTYSVDVDQVNAPINNATLTTANEPATVIVTAGSTTNVADIGYLIQGQISGTVYHDQNGSLAFDATPLPADTPLSGQIVRLYDAGMNLLATVNSAADGSYQFGGLAAGSYTVEVVTPATFTAVAPAATAPTLPTLAVTLAGGQQLGNQDFGFSQAPNLQVSKTTPSSFAARNSTIVYTVTITNTGGVANKVMITDYLPDVITPVGWAGPVAPTPSADILAFPAQVTPQATTITLNGTPVAFTENLAGVALTWSTAAGGFTLANGDVLQIVFAVDEANGTEGSYFNSLSVTEGTPAATTWYPDLNVVNVTRTYLLDKQVVAINGTPYTAGGVPTINVGDVVSYEISVTNLRGQGRIGRDEIAVQTLTDTLPLGFKYVPGSAVLTSPGNLAPNPQPAPDPVVTPATATTQEVMNYTFNVPAGKTNPNPPNMAAPHLITGPGLNSTATLRYDAVAYDAVTPHSPSVGQQKNQVLVQAERLGKNPPIAQTVIGGTVTVSAQSLLKGTLFHDINGNLVYDAPPAGDLPFSGVTVELRPAAGGAAVSTATTNANGAYTLLSPSAGSYQIVVTDTTGVLNGYTNTVSPALPVNVTAAQILSGLDFAYVVNGTPGQVNGTVFQDTNANGVLDGGEAGLAAVTVWLKNPAGNVLNTTTTAANGSYSFANLPAGAYQVDVDQASPALNGLYSTPQAAPADPASVTITAGGNVTQNFGWATGSRFTGTVFDDANNDGVQQVGEPGHGGVTLNLVDTGTGLVVQTVTTGATPATLGQYGFLAVPPGSYRIDVTDTTAQLSGYTLTTGNQPMTPVTVTAGTNPVTSFGYFLTPNLTVTKTLANSSLGRGEDLDTTLTVTNSGGGVSAFSVADVLPAVTAPASPFAGGAGGYTASAIDYFYKQTLSVTLNGQPLVAGVDYAAPAANSTTPTWGNIALPGKSTLIIHFLANDPARKRGGPNYNGASMQYGTPSTVTDFPDLALFSVVRDLTYSKALLAVDGTPYTGAQTISGGSRLTFELRLANTLRARAQTVNTFTDVLPADLAGNGVSYIPCPAVPCSQTKLTDPATGQVLAVIGDPAITAGAVGSGISQTLVWSLANGSWATDPATQASFPSDIVLQYDVFVTAGMAAGNYSNNSTAVGSRAGGGNAFTVYGSVPFAVSVAPPVLTVLKTVNSTQVNPGQAVTYTVQVNNTGQGAATSVVLDDTLSPYLNFGVNSFGANTPFSFTDGAPPSTLTPGTASYTDRNGAPYPTLMPGANGASANFDGNVGTWSLPMTGTMPAGSSFSIQYKAEVR